eukprot:30858-Pelagococcus_subviridis.AAC.12
MRALHVDLVPTARLQQVLDVIRVEPLHEPLRPHLHPDVRHPPRAVQDHHRDVPQRREMHLVQHALTARAHDADGVPVQHPRERDHEARLGLRDVRAVRDDDPAHRGVQVSQPFPAVRRVFAQVTQRVLHRPAVDDDDHARAQRAHDLQRVRLALPLELRVDGPIVVIFRRRANRRQRQRVHEIAHADPVLVLDDLREHLHGVLDLRSQPLLPRFQLAVRLPADEVFETLIESRELLRGERVPRRRDGDRSLGVERAVLCPHLMRHDVRLQAGRRA